MKKFYVVLFLSIMALAMMTSVLSCKKSDDSSPASVLGFWKGTLSGGPFSGNLDLLFRSNGTVRSYQASSDTSTAITVDGIYTISKKNVSLSIGVATMAVTVNDQNTSMNGTLTQSGATSNYSATKQ